MDVKSKYARLTSIIFTDTEVNNCFSIYHRETQKSVISANILKSGWDL